MNFRRIEKSKKVADVHIASQKIELRIFPG
jgi:hypothetical protein